MINLAKPKQVISSERFIEIIGALFILLFVYTAASKLMDHEKFRAVLLKSPLLSYKANLISYLVPFSEIMTAVLLFIPGTRRIGLVLSLTLMIVFTGYIGYMIVFTPRLPCSCGGVISKLSWKGHLILNGVLTLLAAGAVFDNKLFIAINRGHRKPVNRVGNSFHY